MNQLIALAARELGGETVQTVNARDLHAFLGVGKVFAAWIKERIAQYDFIEGRDFVCFPVLESKEGRGGHNQIDYHVTLDMAKELCMVERNEKGKQARQYFIECERRAKSRPRDPLEVLNDPSAMRSLLLTYTEKVLALQGKVDAMQPDVEALLRIERAEGAFNITSSAKILQLQPKQLFQWLSHNQWIYRRVGGHGWLGYQDKIQAGLIEHKITTFDRADGSKKVFEQVLITPKGLTKLARLFAQLPLPTFQAASYGAGQALRH